LKPHGGLPVVAAGAGLDESRAAIIMIHGRNAGPRNILDLVPRLGRPGFSYLAPTASNNTWYPYGFMEETAKNEPGIPSALQVLDQIVADVVARGVRKDHVMLLGFSQGACLAAQFAVSRADRYGGVIVCSGGLIGPPGSTWDFSGSFAGTPVFLGCSDSDAHIPKARVEESAAIFERMGAAVTTRLYAGMGHLINDDEIVIARTMMDRVQRSG
jgi:phospholipase/carboxylesterase